MPRPQGGFRFQGKKMLLTYSQSGPLDKGALHAFLETKMKQPLKVKICHETHEDGNIHTHCAVQAEGKMDIQSANFLDFEGHHPNIKPPMNIEHWRNQVKYIDKEDPDVYGEIEVPKDKGELFSEACEFVKQCKTRKQMYAPGPYLMIISSKVNFFENFWKTQKKKKVTQSSFQMTSFNKAPITDWTTSWLVWGRAGSGKTQWALAHFKNPLLVSTIDDLHEYDEEEHDGIVFDDMSFKHMPGQAIIHLLDIDLERSIHCRYINATIPANTKKIFCHNNADIFVPEKETTEEQMNGISRRYQSVQIENLLY
jgi:hypothetical protein